MTNPHPPHGPSPDSGGSPPAADPALRRKADAVCRARTAGLPNPFEASLPEAAQSLVHELRVHQIELEMQNEELRRTQVELAATRARYFDLFDLAPVGYLIVRESGLILQANLTAAAMLGEVRGELTDRPVSHLMFKADQDAWYLCRKRLVDTGEPQSCELRVVKPDGTHLWVRVAMSAACADDGTSLHRVTLTDIGERKQAEASRQTSEERLRIALTAATAIGFIWDAASDSVARYFSTVPTLPVNVDAPEPVAAVRARVHPDDVGLFDAGVAECLGEGTEYRNLYRVVDPGGSIRWLQEWGCLERDAAGRPLRLTGISIDVSELKRAETSLRESEQRYRLAIRATHDAVWDIDVTNDTVHWSDKYASKFGRPPETANSWQWWIDRIHPDDRDRTAGSARAAVDGTVEAWACEYRFGLQNGQWADIRDRAYIARDPAGKAVRVVGAMLDVTAFRRASAERDRMWNLSLDPMCLSGFDGYFKQVNPAWERTLEWTAEELTSRPWLDFVHADDRQATLNIAGQLIGGQLVYHFENRYQHKDGTYRWLSWNSYPAVEQQIIFSIARDVTEQKRAEEALRESDEQLRAIIDNTPECVKVLDRDGKLLTMNPAGLRMIEADDLEQVRGVRVCSGLNPVEQCAFDQLVAATFRGEHGSLVFEMQGLKGTWRTLETHSVPMWDADHREVRALLGVTRDITEQKRAQDALRASEERLRLALDAGRMGIFDWDLETNAIIWSDTHYEMFGYPAGEQFPVVYRHFIDRIHPDDLSAVEQAIRTAMDQRVIYTSEHRLLLPDGSVHWNLGTGAFQYDSEGRPVRMIGTVKDITERKQAEADLVMRDRAIQAVNQGIVITDPNLPDNPIVYVSPGFERMTGYASAEVVGCNCRFLQGPATDKVEIARIAEAIRAVQPCAVEVLNYRKDGSTIWNELSITPVRDPDGRLVHFVGIQTDVTARRSLEDQLRQAHKMEAVGQLAGGVAHDFNNLLTVINGYGDLLLSELPKGDPHREYVASIRDAGKRATRLTRQLLAFSRKTILAPQVLDLREMVEKSAKMLRPLIGEDIVLAIISDPAPVRVSIDPGQLDQVIMNLVLNARDAMPNGGNLTVEAKTVELDEEYARLHPDVTLGKYALMSVSDSGSGMTPEVKARLFEPYFTTKGVGKGTGLGLAMVMGIVKQSGGHVAVYSELDHGTTVKLHFPAVEEQADTTKGHSDVAAVRGAETVLLVEDEDAIRGLAFMVLQSHGYKVLSARDSQEALRLVAKHQGPIQLLLTDVVMPGMGGRELADALQPRYPQMKVLYSSGYNNDDVVRHGIVEAEVAFLRKPYSPKELASTVRHVLDQK